MVSSTDSGIAQAKGFDTATDETASQLPPSTSLVAVFRRRSLRGPAAFSFPETVVDLDALLFGDYAIAARGEPQGSRSSSKTALARPAPSELEDARLERAIVKARDELVNAPPELRRAKWERMRALVLRRSPEQVRRMEVAKGLSVFGNV